MSPSAVVQRGRAAVSTPHLTHRIRSSLKTAPVTTGERLPCVLLHPSRELLGARVALTCWRLCALGGSSSSSGAVEAAAAPCGLLEARRLALSSPRVLMEA